MRMKVSNKKKESWFFVIGTKIGDVRIYLNEWNGNWSTGTIYTPHDMDWKMKSDAETYALNWANREAK